jgi:hypothetical protein
MGFLFPSIKEVKRKSSVIMMDELVDNISTLQDHAYFPETNFNNMN